MNQPRQGQHHKLPPVPLNTGLADKETRTHLVHYLGLIGTLRFAAGYLDGKVQGPGRAAIKRLDKVAGEVLTDLLAPGPNTPPGKERWMGQKERQRKAEALAAAISEVVDEFKKSGYAPEFLYAARSFNDGSLRMADGRPVKELDLRGQLEDPLNQAKVDPADMRHINEEHVAPTMDMLEGMAAAHMTPEERIHFYLELAERCTNVAKYHYGHYQQAQLAGQSAPDGGAGGGPAENHPGAGGDAPDAPVEGPQTAQPDGNAAR